jgi:ribosomal protein S18 acetylase RimI-like enzyme
MRSKCKGSVRIRPALEADVPAMARLNVETKRECYTGFYPIELLMHMSAEKTALSWRRNLFGEPTRSGVFAMVAENERGEMIGILIAGPEASQSARTTTGEIYVLYVLPRCQQAGVGRALVRAATRCLLADGFTGLLIWVLAENPSRAFYEALGGRVVRSRMLAFEGYDLPEVAYGWEELRSLAGLEEKHAESDRIDS